MDWLQKMQEESRRRHAGDSNQKFENVVEFVPEVKEVKSIPLRIVPPKNVKMGSYQPKEIIRFSNSEDHKKNTERPPAQYTNLSSPYGIATDLHLKKE